VASSVSLGPVMWTGGLTLSGLLGRQIWCGTKTVDGGSASAVAPQGGVYPGGGEMKVTPPGGMFVTVSAGYCCVPHPTAGHGAYVFGTMVSETITIASNSSGSLRTDLIAARVYDTNNSSSYCDVEVVAGTPGAGAPALPAAAIRLAQVAVAGGATSITLGNITDRRAYAVPAGCMLPIASASAAPAAGPEQLMYDIATGLVCRGTGTAGAAAAVGYSGLAGFQNVNTSSGATGITPGTPSAEPWGIGYGEVDTSGGGGGKGGGGGGGSPDTDGTLATQLQVAFTADGQSDYELFWKWQLAIPAQAYIGGSTLAAAGVTLSLLVDGSETDSVLLLCADDPPGSSGGGSASWYTSGSQGTTLSPGRHTATLVVETAGSYSATGPVSGVFIGDVAGGGATTIGAAAAGYYASLVKENCLLRVQSVPAS
jgi:hypothetical protein